MRDIGDARAELDAIDARSDLTPPHAQSPVRKWRTVAAASIGLIAGTIAVWMARGISSAGPPQVLHVSVRLSPDQRIVATGAHLVRIAISPDGRRVVYGANRQLHLRPLDADESTPIANTEDAAAPFFSPDGQSIGFLQNGRRLVVLALSGGTPIPLADVGSFGGARWGSDGTVVYADATRGVFHVDSAGGTPVQVAAAESGVVFAPEALPGSKWVLYGRSSGPMTLGLFLTQLGMTPASGQFETVAYNVETGERRVIVKNAPASYLATGHLMYGGDQNAVFVAPFDAVRAELTGSETRILLSQQNGLVRDVSLNGTLAFVSVLPNVRRRPVWVTREGSQTLLPLEPGAYRFPRLSPNGSRLAVTRDDVRLKATDIWIYDVNGSTTMRLTWDGQSTTPAWTSDGARLAYSSFGKGGSRLFTTNADGSGSPQPLSEGSVRFPYAWFDRNTKLVFAEIRDGQLDIGMVANASGSADRVWLSSPANETRPDVSPDERWLAYTSNESSSDEIYVRPMADLESGSRWQVSNGGGHSPIWVSGGRELVYRAPGQMMSVAIRPGETFGYDAPRLLFVDPYVNDSGGRSYDVAADGRFLMLSDEANSTDEIHLIVNWFEELRRQLQAK